MPTTMDNSLKNEFEFYLAHQAQFVEKYNGRVIVLKEHVVLGDYATPGDAIRETVKSHAIGTFLVQEVTPGSDAYTATYRSRVLFS